MDDHDSGEEVESDWIFFKAIVNNDGFFFLKKSTNINKKSCS